MAERTTEAHLFISGRRAEPTKKLFKIGNLCGARSTLVESNLIESGRAEPMKKANGNRFFVAQVHHGIDTICSNGGRAEI